MNGLRQALASHRASLSRRTLLGAGLLLVAGHSAAGPIGLPSARSMRDELTLAIKAGQPLVVLVSLDGCPFCRTVRDHHLSPLRTQQGLPVVQLDMGSAAAVHDFDGMARTHDALVRSWKVAIAPSVLFFGPGGAEVAPRLLGAGLADYYGAYLDERLAQARSVLKRP